MVNYTSSLPENTLEKLNDLAKQIKVPKNEIINRALINYMEAVERQMYIQSFKKLAGDKDILNIAEEGMSDYLVKLLEYEER